MITYQNIILLDGLKTTTELLNAVFLSFILA